MIFVNTVNFAETVLNVLKKRGLKAFIIFGKMSNEERDEYVEKFRKQEINVIITTNLLSRGIDVPEIQVVINFDVPKQKNIQTGKFEPDEENYLHRIGRAGRFGVEGIALTLFDNDEDEMLLDQIMSYYKMEDKI